MGVDSGKDINEAANIRETVSIEDGWVKGISEDEVTVFKGIPFAAPPVGELRWKYPQPIIPWKGILSADKFGKACPQVFFPDVASIDNKIGETSEDCLYLNVWTPAKLADEKRPVMVWIHGGGFAIGATNSPNFSGEKLAQRGVILVSIAYRVGVLGYMAHPELSAEDPDGISGNYGLRDQIAGLKWVQNNIAAFGGDPANVTIFGESAGAISVSILCASPLAKGLFKRAISQSGGAFGPILKDRAEGGTQKLENAEQNGLAFAKRMGTDKIDDLRKIPPEAFLKDPQAGMGGFWPICDGMVITGDPFQVYKDGRQNEVDVIIGTNSNEGALFVFESNANHLKKLIKDRFAPLDDKALEVFPATDDAIALQSERNIFRDTAFAWHSWTWAKFQQTSTKSNVFVYYFDQHQPEMGYGLKISGAGHSDEINYVFGQVDENLNFKYTDEDRQLSGIIMDYWVNFAKTGNPNSDGLVEWPRFVEGHDTVLYLKGTTPTLGPIANRPQLEFVDEHFRWLRESR